MSLKDRLWQCPICDVATRDPEGNGWVECLFCRGANDAGARGYARNALASLTGRLAES